MRHPSFVAAYAYTDGLFYYTKQAFSCFAATCERRR